METLCRITDVDHYIISYLDPIVDFKNMAFLNTHYNTLCQNHSWTTRLKLIIAEYDKYTADLVLPKCDKYTCLFYLLFSQHFDDLTFATYFYRKHQEIINKRVFIDYIFLDLFNFNPFITIYKTEPCDKTYLFNNFAALITIDKNVNHPYCTLCCAFTNYLIKERNKYQCQPQFNNFANRIYKILCHQPAIPNYFKMDDDNYNFVRYTNHLLYW